MIELKNDEFYKVLELFSDLRDCTPVYSILNNNSASRIFVDDKEKPSSAFMWNEFRYSYIAGNSENEKFNENLALLLKNELLPVGKESNDPTMVFYPDNESWLLKTDEILQGKLPLAINRQLFKFNKEYFQKLKFSFNEAIQIKRMDKKILNDLDDAILDDIQMSWISLERFLEKGVGFILLKDDELISSCHSCFADDHSFETSIKTYDEKFRRKGYATAVTVKYIEYCLENGIEPKWECWEGNESSVQLAEKMGFVKTTLYPVKFILLNEADELMENAFYYRFDLKKYEESAEFFEKAFELMEDVEAENLYFCSCSFALAENPIKTVEYLKKAIQNGFNDFDRIKNEEAFKIIGNSLDLENILRI